MEFYKSFTRWVEDNMAEWVLPICVVGNIGVGKSTYVEYIKTAVKDFPNVVVVVEPIDEFEMIFKRFCREPATAANWQIANANHFSSVMIEYIERAMKTNTKHVVIFERSPFCCKHVFLPLQRTYSDKKMNYVADNMLETVCTSDGWRNAFIVCLQFTNTEKAITRIRSRARPGEEGISIEYWMRINVFYQMMMHDLSFSHSTVCFDVTDVSIDKLAMMAARLGVGIISFLHYNHEKESEPPCVLSDPIAEKT